MKIRANEICVKLKHPIAFGVFQSGRTVIQLVGKSLADHD